MKKVYLDHAATTPVDPKVFSAMEPFFSNKFGNTMSLHGFGQEAKLALEQSRETIANALGVNSEEIIFTGSATESNNLALKGVASKGKHIIISSIEHPCIMESAKWLEKQGIEITRLKVDKYGLVDIEEVKKSIKDNTVLVSVIHASNEIGTIEPINEIAKICKERGVYFHTDASQSFGKIPIDISNIDLLTASSHKIYGPKGAAFLYVKKGVKIEPFLHGGGQERGLRGSTVNVPAIVGFAKATELCMKEMKEEGKRLSKLRDYFIKKALKIEDSHLNGHSVKRLPNNINIWFNYVEGESVTIQLDLEGIAVSTGSACSSFKLEPSHVLMAIGLKPQEAHGSSRITLGRWTKKSDIDYLLKVLPKIIKRIRQISPFSKHEK